MPKAKAEKGGRPLVYRDHFAVKARKRCAEGAVLRDLAEQFGVERRTVQEWMRSHPDFGAAVRIGRAEHKAALNSGRQVRRTRSWSPDKKLAPAPKQITRMVLRYVSPDDRRP